MLRYVAPKARANIAVFRDTGSEWVPESFDRTPWAVIRLKHRELLMKAYFAANLTTTSYGEISTNTLKTLSSNPSAGAAFNAFATPAQSIRWGSGTTGATDTDFHLTGEADQITVTSTYDIPNATTYFSGAKVFTGATATLREVGLTTSMLDTASAVFTFMIDRTLTAPLRVETNRLVAAEYTWSF
jgi:hypothetical protein